MPRKATPAARAEPNQAGSVTIGGTVGDVGGSVAGRDIIVQGVSEQALLAIVAAVRAEKGVPTTALTAILAYFGDSSAPLDPSEIENRLRAKADEFLDLQSRLRRLSNNDPAVAKLRTAAADHLNAARFSEADATLAEAERIDLAAVEELESAATQRRLSAAASRAERAAAARLRLAYREAAVHYEAAATMVPPGDTTARLRYIWSQVESLYKQGNEFGDNTALAEAIHAARSALDFINRQSAPRDWANWQIWLGNALATLGERESGTARLEEAGAAYRAALLEHTRDRVPLDWAMTQNNLGNALQTLGDRESGTARLEEAVAAYRAALLERTRDRVPLDWAMTQNNLGNALQTLGERESSTARLEEAVAAYHAALLEHTRDRVPLDWAMTQNNLGNALQTLGERESSTARLEEAVAAYHAALLERTRDRVPLDWAATQNNLGVALRALGKRESGTARLEEALSCCDAALSIVVPAGIAPSIEMFRRNRDRAAALIAERRAVMEQS